MKSITKRERAVMRNILYSLTAIALIVGCSSKEEQSFLNIYEKNKVYHHELQKTEKIELSDGEYTKVLVTATYLFEPIPDQIDTRDEKFIVGIYIENEEEDTFSQGDYNLTLGGVLPKNIKVLKENDPRLKDISFLSEWSQFYLFTFPHTQRKSFNLLFQSELYGNGTLHFAKVAKYVLTKEAF